METSETTYDIHFIKMDRTNQPRSYLHTTYYSESALNEDIEGIVELLKSKGALDVWVIKKVVTTTRNTFMWPHKGDF